MGSCGDGRMLRKVFDELELSNSLKFNRINPSDVIIFPDFEVPIRNDCFETADKLCQVFPQEKSNIVSFFETINEKNFLKIYSEFRNQTFKEMLDRYFKKDELKSFFQVLLGNVGLPSSKVAAITAIVMYRQFVFDGGYYPTGSMQAIPNALVSRFKSYGGTILFSATATSLKVKNKKVTGVVINKEEIVHSKYVVSNSDAKSLFEIIENKETAPNRLREKLNTLKTSISAFIVYLGVKSISCSHKSSVWFFNTYDVDKVYLKAYEGIFDPADDYCICTFPSFHDDTLAPSGYDSMSIIIAAPSENKTKEFIWSKEKETVTEILIGRVKRNLLPNLNEIKIKIAATPSTLERYTLNNGGALYGWASTLDQIDAGIVPQKTFFENLYMAGHWVTPGLGQGGVTGVAFSGRSAAKRILLLEKKQNLELVRN